jgi:hypothetical protein
MLGYQPSQLIGLASSGSSRFQGIGSKMGKGLRLSEVKHTGQRLPTSWAGGLSRCCFVGLFFQNFYSFAEGLLPFGRKEETVKIVSHLCLEHFVLWEEIPSFRVLCLCHYHDTVDIGYLGRGKGLYSSWF